MVVSIAVTLVLLVLLVQLSVDQKPFGVYRNDCVFVDMKLFRGNMNVGKVVVRSFESSRIIVAQM